MPRPLNIEICLSYLEKKETVEENLKARISTKTPKFL